MAVDRTTYASRSYAERCAWLFLIPLLMGAGGDPYAGAQAALEAGTPQKALTHLDGASGPISDYAALLKAKAHAALKQEKAAVAAARTVSRQARRCEVPDVLFLEAQALVADLMAQTAPATAAAALLALPASGPTLDRARRLLAPVDPAAATRAMQRLLVEAPESPEARALAKQAGRLPIELRIKRVYALLSTHQNRAAHTESRALLKRLPKDHPEVCRLRYTEGKAARKLRKYSTAIKALESARASCGENKKYLLNASLLLTHVRGIRRQVAGTKEIADWFAKEHPTHSYADDAMLVHAHVLERRGQRKKARAVYRRIVNELPDGDEAPSAAWRLAFEAIERRRYVEAEPLLEWILGKEVRRPVDHARARYWLARVYEETKRKEKALTTFERVAMEPTFYAWLTLDRLKRLDTTTAERVRKRLVALVSADAMPTIPVPKAIAGDPAYARAEAFFAAARPDLAAVELSQLACGELDRPSALALASTFDRYGAFRDAQMVLRTRKKRFLTSPLSDEDLVIWRMAYSRPYLDLVKSAADSEKLEATFLLALVREESTFDPQIVSWAGATGLAQLMPATAIGAYATVFKKRLRNLDRLTQEPDLNLRLGAHVLKDGMARWNNTEALALSAYNGGHGLTKKIVPAAPKAFELWVETIPVKETRRYVKRVIETWGIYRLLYDRSAPFIKLPQKIGGEGISL